MTEREYSDAALLGILKSCRTFAMVGASPNWNRPSSFAMKYLQSKGYHVIPVNPRAAGGEILGETVYASLADIPGRFDMVDVFRTGAAVPGIVDEIIPLIPEKGIRVLWTQLGVCHEGAAEKAAAAGKTAEVEEDLSQLEGLHLEATARDRAGEKSPVLWLVLTIVFSLVVYYIYYFLNDDFRAHEANEQQFMAKASDIMTKLGIVQQPITPSMVVPERTFVKYLLLTIFTCGIYGIYWWYTLITDPNLHFDNHATWETQLSTALSSS